MSKLRVGISGINAVDNPGPGLAVARSLKQDKQLDIEIIGLAYDALEPGVYMDWVIDHAFLMPYPSRDGEGYLSRLLDIQRTTGLDVIIPNLDAELPFYVRYADRLAQEGITTFLPDLQQFQLRGKDRLPKLAKEIGVLTPRTEVVVSLEELHRAVHSIGLPCMVKGPYYKAHLAHSVPEAVEWFHKYVAEWGYPVIVQQVVTGDELNVVTVGDGEGGTLGQVAIKKMWVTEQGKMWTGVTVQHEAMLKTTEQFIRGCQWRGPCEIECIVSGDDVYLIEINPRFPAWVFGATGVGVNLPSRLLRHSLGMPLPELSPYKPGQLFIRYSYEMVTDMQRFQQMLTAGGTVRIDTAALPV